MINPLGWLRRTRTPRVTFSSGGMVIPARMPAEPIELADVDMEPCACGTLVARLEVCTDGPGPVVELEQTEEYFPVLCRPGMAPRAHRSSVRVLIPHVCGSVVDRIASQLGGH